MLLALRDYTKISEMDGPQTRTEKKGLDKKGGVIYSAKHVRLTAALVSMSKGRVGVEPVRVEPKAPRKKR
jgi:hypothetical protein